MPRPIIALVAVAILGLTGCSLATTPVVSGTPGPAAATNQSPSPSPKPTVRVAAFGQTATFSRGVAVTVTVTSVAATTSAAGAVEGRLVVVTERITNGSDQAFDGRLMSRPSVTYGPDGVKAENATDFGNNNAHEATAGMILPGETQTAVATYGIPTAGFSDVRVAVDSPDRYSELPAVFKGSVS